MNILCSYNGKSNLDETLDDNISYLIGKYFYDNKIGFKILDLDFIKPEPNINDELVRYQIEMDVNPTEFKIDWIRKELEIANFDKGLTIKSENHKILFADENTADIIYRRRIRSQNKQSFRS